MLIQIKFLTAHIKAHVFATIFFVPYKSNYSYSQVWCSQKVHDPAIEAVGCIASAFIIRFNRCCAKSTLCFNFCSAKNHYAESNQKQEYSNAFHHVQNYL